MIYVYKHIRLDTNEIFYIGIGKYKYRPYSKHNRNNYWRNIVNKTKYDVKIITKCDTWEEACLIEKYLITFYGRRDLGTGSLVNMTDGGEGTNNYIKTKEVRENHSKLLKEKYKGENNPFYGKKHSEEVKKYISDIQKQYFTYDEGSDERITNKKYNDSINNKKSKKVINIRTNKIFNCLREAAEYYNISYHTLKGRMRGERYLRNELQYLEKDEQTDEISQHKDKQKTILF